MKHSELLKSYELNKLDENTVFIHNKHFNFSYTKADSIAIKDEFKGQFRYFGGLQCGFEKDSQQYKRLESNLCEIAESVLGENKSESIINLTNYSMFEKVYLAGYKERANESGLVYDEASKSYAKALFNSLFKKINK